MKVAVRVAVVGSHDLPPEYCEQIGRILVKFAYLEQYLKRVPMGILKLSLAQGFVAVRSPRMSELMDMITDLDSLSPCNFPAGLIASLKPKLADLERRRDLLAHAGWALVDGEWCLLNTKGSWNKQGPTGAPKGKRVITPEFDPVSLERLRTLVVELDQAIQEVRKFGDALGRNS